MYVCCVINLLSFHRIHFDITGLSEILPMIRYFVKFSFFGYCLLECYLSVTASSLIGTDLVRIFCTNEDSPPNRLVSPSLSFRLLLGHRCSSETNLRHI